MSFDEDLYHPLVENVVAAKSEHRGAGFHKRRVGPTSNVRVGDTRGA